MQGLISGAQQPQQNPKNTQQAGQAPQSPSQPGQQDKQGPGAPGGQGAASSQEAYNVATGQMLNFVYDQQGMDALAKMVQASGDPQQGMARLFGRLLTMTVQSASMTGKKIAPEVIFQGGIEVIRAISEVAQNKGIIDPAQEKEIAEAAFFDGLALFAKEAAEESLSEAERQRYIELLDMAEQIEAEGGGMPQGRQQVAGNDPSQRGMKA
jgi:hypothetical protein